MQTNTSRRYSIYIFTGVLFLFCLAFFCAVHPLVPYDADDWYFLSKSRIAIPEWGSWNPTRVFPEVLEPTCALVGTYFVSLFTETWLDSQIVVNGIIASVFVTSYTMLFERLLEVKARCKRSISLFLSLLFLTLHFLVFRVAQYNNSYMFGSNDVAAFYVYVLSNLLCASVVMYMIIYDSFDTFFSSKTTTISKGVFILSIYFAFLSNIFASSMVAIYIMVTLFSKLIIWLKEKDKFDSSQILKGVWLRIILLCFWAVVLLFEVNGGRSHQIGSDNSFISQVVLTLNELFSVQINLLYICIVLIPLLAFILMNVDRQKVRSATLKMKTKCLKNEAAHQEISLVLTFIICSLLCLLFLILVCSKASPSYISRADVLFPSFFFLSLGSMIALGKLISSKPITAAALPLILVIAITQCNTSFKTFKETNTDNLPHQICIEVTNNVISQVQDSSNRGLDPIDLYVPQSSKSNNWPFPEYSGNTISGSLYKLGLINKKVDVNIIPDQSMNEEYNIYL